jgi:hypothetical protein
MVLGALASTLTVLTLTIYLLADMPRIRKLIYRLIPASRRPRAILLGDEMFAKVGGYVLGNLLTSLIAGAGTFAWLIIFHVPYPNRGRARYRDPRRRPHRWRRPRPRRLIGSHPDGRGAEAPTPRNPLPATRPHLTLAALGAENHHA